MIARATGCPPMRPTPVWTDSLLPLWRRPSLILSRYPLNLSGSTGATSASISEKVLSSLVPDGIVPGAFGADPVIALQRDLVVGVAALFALDPDPLGDFAFDPGFEPGFHFFEPVQENAPVNLSDQTPPLESGEGESGGDQDADRGPDGGFDPARW